MIAAVCLLIPEDQTQIISSLLSCRIKDLSTHFNKIDVDRGTKKWFRYPDDFVFCFKTTLSAGLKGDAGGSHCIYLTMCSCISKLVHASCWCMCVGSASMKVCMSSVGHFWQVSLLASRRAYCLH